MQLNLQRWSELCAEKEESFSTLDRLFYQPQSYRFVSLLPNAWYITLTCFECSVDDLRLMNIRAFATSFLGDESEQESRSLPEIRERVVRSELPCFTAKLLEKWAGERARSMPPFLSYSPDSHEGEVEGEVEAEVEREVETETVVELTFVREDPYPIKPDITLQRMLLSPSTPLSAVIPLVVCPCHPEEGYKEEEEEGEEEDLEKAVFLIGKHLIADEEEAREPFRKILGERSVKWREQSLSTSLGDIKTIHVCSFISFLFSLSYDFFL